jgi:hypothetical protein
LDSPVFVCGALRSGTTLLGLMLAFHPRIVHAGEMDFLLECPGAANGRPDLPAYARKLRGNRIFRTSQVEIDESLPYKELVRSFADQKRQPGKLLAINVHRNFTRIPEIFPHARFIHLLRDPRDVAHSSVRMGWAGNVYFGVDHWIGSEREFEKLEREVDPDRVHTLRNGALVRQPKNELTRLCAFLGVDYDPAMLGYPNATTYGPPDPTLVGQWRRKLTRTQAALVEAKAEELMTARGYSLSADRIVKPGPLRLLALRLHNRAGRIVFSIRRYGVLWTFLEIAGRRLRLRSVADLAQRKIDDQTVKYLK